MIGYVAKDNDGQIYLHSEEPHYEKGYGSWFSTPDMINITDEFPEFDTLNSFDDPVKVEIKLEKV